MVNDHVKSNGWLKETWGKAISVDSKDKPLNENNGSIIYITGEIRGEELFKDKYFGLQVRGLRLRRVIEMYQWKRKKEDGKSIYHKVWHRRHINSKRYESRYVNPKWPDKESIGNKFFVSNQVAVGQYNIDSGFLKVIPEEPITLTSNMISAGKYLTDKKYRIDGRYLVITNSEKNPGIGDMRISYYIKGYGKGVLYSLVGFQKNKKITGLKDYGANHYIINKGYYDSCQDPTVHKLFC